MNTLFVNGFVYRTTVGPIPGAVLIEDGLIAAFGSEDKVRDVALADTEIVDLAGGLISPSFVDAHLHPAMGGEERLKCDLTAARLRSECLQRIAEYARSNPEARWIMGGGWSLDLFDDGLPTRHILDRIVHDRPTILTSADRHSAWVNSKALEVAGIDRHTPDPKNGRIEREADGSPSGMLHEAAAFLVYQTAPQPNLDLLIRSLEVSERHLFSLGVTGWQDALLRVTPDGVDMVDAYLLGQQRGSLRAKVTGALRWDEGRDLTQLESLIRRREVARAAGPNFCADAIKILVDGVVENFTASLSEPYRDRDGCVSSNFGMSRLSREELTDVVVAADAEGFQLHFHSLGDRAVKDTLEALETAARVNGRRDSRHTAAHLQIVDPSDVRRFAALGVVANLQPFWAQNEPQMTELTVPFLPPKLVAWQYPFGDLVRSGAKIAIGSDWPVSDASPIAGMHVAVNRTNPSAVEREEPFLPAQAIDLRTAWDAYTFGSSFLNRREMSTGSIAIGNAADLVVLDRNPFDGPAESIAETQVVSTWVDGVPVFTAG